MADKIDQTDMSHELYSAAREAMERGDYPNAMDLLRCSFSLHPHFKTMELLGEILLQVQGASAETIIVLSASVGLATRNPRPLFLLATALAKRGDALDIDHAINKLDLAIAYQPTYKKAIELREELRSRYVSITGHRKEDWDSAP